VFHVKTGPTEFYRQHHDVEPPRIDAMMFRTAWKVRTRLDRLLLDRAITLSEWHAAVMLRSMLELVTARGQRASRIEFMPPGAAPYQHEADSAALAHSRRVRKGLGDTYYRLLLACIIDDLSWIALGQRLDVDPRTARAWVIVSIKLLACVFLRTQSVIRQQNETR
jgi:hypothetical protein